MARAPYVWDLAAPPRIGIHSRAKHRILGEYLRRYVRVLTSSAPGMEALNLAVIDGFAGGGRYLADDGELVDGSPFVAIDALREAEVSLNANRRKPIKVNARFYFVDEDAPAMSCLRTLIDRRPDLCRDKDGASVRTFNLAFADALPAVIADIKRSRAKQPRAIFILDQYGYTDVPVGMLRTIFRELPRAEAFVTIAVGWIAAYLRDPADIAQRLGVPRDRIAELATTLREEDALDVRAGRDRGHFFLIQRILREAFVRDTTQFYTPFFIVSRDSNRAYWLLHLANSSKAHDVVKTLHWEYENHFQHFGKAGLDMLGYDPERDADLTRQASFWFDHDARERTRAALRGAVADRLGRGSGAVTFDDLYAGVCNETPATKTILGDAVCDLAAEGSVTKTGAAGEHREARTVPRGDDMLTRSRQIFLDLGKRRP